MYSRQIDGNIITLAASGWTHGEDALTSVFVLTDKETESLWFPAGSGVCTLPAEEVENADCGLVGIGGFYADHSLTGIYTPAVIPWAKWNKTHPDTKFVTD